MLGDAHLHAALDDRELLRLATGELATVKAALCARLRATGPHGAASFVVIDVGAGPPGPGVGTSVAPARSWLYQPRADLPPVPPRWDDDDRRGPDAAWFDEVYALVMDPAARDGA